MNFPFACEYSFLQVAATVAVNLVGRDVDCAILDHAPAVDPHAPRRDEIRREQGCVTLGREIADDRIAGRYRRCDFDRAIVNGLDEPGIAGDHRRPNVPATIDGAEYRHLPAFEKLTRALRKVIDDSFTDVLGDVADSGPFLDRDFSAVKSHRLLLRRCAGRRGMLYRHYSQFHEAGRTVVAVA